MRGQEQVGTGAKYHNLRKRTPPTLGGLFLSDINNYNVPEKIKQKVFNLYSVGFQKFNERGVNN